MGEPEKTEIEAEAFRGLIKHLQRRTDVQNIDLMNLAGFCRNCLATTQPIPLIPKAICRASGPATGSIPTTIPRNGRRQRAVASFCDMQLKGCI